MLIGGYAVIYYGYERNTSDMDIWLQPDNLNKEPLLNALKDFGVSKVGLSKISKLDLTQIQFFYYGEKPRRIDFLTKIKGVVFEDAFPQVNYLPFDKEKVPVIHYHHLILSKITNERAKDIADVEELQKISKHRKLS